MDGREKETVCRPRVSVTPPRPQPSDTYVLPTRSCSPVISPKVAGRLIAKERTVPAPKPVEESVRSRVSEVSEYQV
jgi:hypothetical protein